MARIDPFQPVLGDDIGPTGVQRARSGVLLAILVVVLGIVAAVSLAIVVLVVWTLVKTAVG